MRKIGQLDTEVQARTLSDYLLHHNIPNQIEPAGKDADAPWSVWVYDEQQVETGRALLSRYRSMPDAEEFDLPRRKPERKPAEIPLTAAASAAARRRTEIVSIPIPDGRPGIVTLVLIGLCILVALITEMGQNTTWVSYLRISNSARPPADPLHFWKSLTLIGSGEIWRLFTPVFLHFTLWHLLFNMLWLQDLGTLLEHKLGAWHVLLLIAILALTSNVCQYILGGGNFGGMSGVVYGLFGYLLARGKAEPAFGTWISPVTSTMLLLFLALGFFGILGPIANAAHLSGLITGGILGYASGLRKHPRAT